MRGKKILHVKSMNVAEILDLILKDMNLYSVVMKQTSQLEGNVLVGTVCSCSVRHLMTILHGPAFLRYPLSVQQADRTLWCDE